MILFPSALLAACGSRAPGPVPLELDFAGGTYRAEGVTYASLAAIPGYTFARSGEQGAVDIDGSVDWFAANVPAVNGRGFHAYGALTNNVPQSNDFQAWTPLVDGAGTGAGPVITPNQADGPDGAASADLIAIPARSATTRRQIIYRLHGMALGANAAGIWVRAKAVGDVGKQIVLTPYDGSSGTDLLITLTSDWQRITGLHIANAVIAPNTSFGRNAAAAGTDAVDFYAWEASSVPSSFLGGPLIRTGAAAASIGSSELRVNLANGEYSATFTFDDDSQQVLPMTVSGGQFVHPVMGALNRAIVKKCLVAPA